MKQQWYGIEETYKMQKRYVMIKRVTPTENYINFIKKTKKTKHTLFSYSSAFKVYIANYLLAQDHYASCDSDIKKKVNGV